jgi:hypothetical protein
VIAAIWPPCLLRTTTGIPCPSCGMTRAAAALAHGDWLAALAWHPLAPFLAIEAIVLAGWLGARRLRGVPPRPPQAVIDRILAANAAIIVVVWLARLASGWRG